MVLQQEEDPLNKLPPPPISKIKDNSWIEIVDLSVQFIDQSELIRPICLCENIEFAHFGSTDWRKFQPLSQPISTKKTSR